ncbi:transcription initiation factor IIA subunit 1-like [Liolophura sinensis]|uniref:transcription initiation factor IIA subunit 1-like n=1 Tax=Liolophura sinensis TaxID=3198878 RepID=UPI003158D68D
MASQSTVPKLYMSVVEDVITNVRESFQDEQVDDQVLEELKQLWVSKLKQAKAFETVSAEPEPILPTTFMMQQHHQLAQPVQPAVTASTIPQQIQHVPLQISSAELSGAAGAATMALPAGIFQQQLAALTAGGITLQHTGASQYIHVMPGLPPGAAGQPQVMSSINLAQPAALTTAHLQAQPAQQVQIAQQPQHQQNIVQLDGAGDTSSEEEEDFDNDDNDDDHEEEQNEEDNEFQGEEEEPLNSEDDVSDEDPGDLFDTDNVVVCQYDKINRSKSKWKFHLKDGIMNLNSRDYVFQKATGDAEW